MKTPYGKWQTSRATPVLCLQSTLGESLQCTAMLFVLPAPPRKGLLDVFECLQAILVF